MSSNIIHPKSIKVSKNRVRSLDEKRKSLTEFNFHLKKARYHLNIINETFLAEKLGEMSRQALSQRTVKWEAVHEA
jgi:hypothetical protein